MSRVTFTLPHFTDPTDGVVYSEIEVIVESTDGDTKDAALLMTTLGKGAVNGRRNVPANPICFDSNTAVSLRRKLSFRSIVKPPLSWRRSERGPVLERGTLTFSENSVPKVLASIQVIGTTSFSSGTWMWGWANESLPSNVTKAVAKVREFGEAANIGRTQELHKVTGGAYNAFLKIDGIPGESSNDKHKDWINIENQVSSNGANQDFQSQSQSATHSLD